MACDVILGVNNYHGFCGMQGIHRQISCIHVNPTVLGHHREWHAEWHSKNNSTYTMASTGKSYFTHTLVILEMPMLVFIFRETQCSTCHHLQSTLPCTNEHDYNPPYIAKTIPSRYELSFPQVNHNSMKTFPFLPKN